MSTIGSRIATKRKSLSMTQEDLAKSLGVSSQAVSKWENDLSCPDITLLPQLAKTLNCTTDYILSGKKDQVSYIPENQRKNPQELILRIRIHSAAGDKIRINVPFGLLKAFSGAGMDIAAQYSGMDALKGIDMNGILDMIENGTVGKIVEMESTDGSIVEIVVE